MSDEFTVTRAKAKMKNIVGYVAAGTTGSVAKQLIQQNVAKSGIGYITIPLGTMFVGLIASKVARDYTDGVIDALFDNLIESGIIVIETDVSSE